MTGGAPGEKLVRQQGIARIMTPTAFALFNLALYLGILVVLFAAERRGRRWHHRWHRDVRYRRISSEEVMRMIEKATKR